MELTNIKTISELMERHGVRFTKALGQNFLTNPSVCPRMAELGGAAPGVCVLEIGPGVGVLTRELAARADKVMAVELDKGLLPILAETLADYPNASVINEDILKLDLKALFEQEFAGREVIVCANLPYYITSPVIMKLLEERLPISKITVMVQKEAAQRLCAPVPSRECGAISVAARFYCEPGMLFPVSRGSFVPAPNVDSAVIRLDLHKTPPVDVICEQTLFKVIRGAFSQRRKTILNCLSSSMGFEKAKMSELLGAAGIAANSRAEQLSLEDFARIANAVKADRSQQE